MLNYRQNILHINFLSKTILSNVAVQLIPSSQALGFVSIWPILPQTVCGSIMGTKPMACDDAYPWARSLN